MSQGDVVEWLASQRRSGNNNYFTVREICDGLKKNGYGFFNVDLQVSQLVHYGVLDMRTLQEVPKGKNGKLYVGWLRRCYRIKAKYVGGKA